MSDALRTRFLFVPCSNCFGLWLIRSKTMTQHNVMAPHKEAGFKGSPVRFDYLCLDLLFVNSRRFKPMVVSRCRNARLKYPVRSGTHTFAASRRGGGLIAKGFLACLSRPHLLVLILNRLGKFDESNVTLGPPYQGIEAGVQFTNAERYMHDRIYDCNLPVGTASSVNETMKQMPRTVRLSNYCKCWLHILPCFEMRLARRRTSGDRLFPHLCCFSFVSPAAPLAP